MTVPSNLVMVLCGYHHRALHLGEIAIDGDPEAGTLRFLDRFGRPIEPPGLDPPRDPPPGDQPPPYTPPLGERLLPGSFTWN